MKTVPLGEHPSNLDPTARLVAESFHERWSIYAVKGGYVLVIDDGMAVLDLFPTDHDARKAFVENF